MAGTNKRIKRRWGAPALEQKPPEAKGLAQGGQWDGAVGKGLVCAAGSGGRVQLSTVGCGATGGPVTSFALSIPKLQPDGRRSPQPLEAI